MKKVALCLTMCLAFSGLSQAQSPKLNLELDEISVSGLSSGGYMATQFHLAQSDWVTGAGIIAAGPYYCARNNIRTALEQCVNKLSGSIDLEALNKQADSWVKEGKLAAFSNLKNSKVWLLNGSKDSKIIGPVNQALFEQYRAWVGDENIEYVHDKPFAHHFPTLTNGNACDVSEPPFLGNCGYDAAGELLNFIYPDLQARVALTSGKISPIKQQKLGGDAASSLAHTGYVYIPQSCQQGESCRLHISFHGCNQNAEAVGTAYVEQSGFNNWADNNNLVVLYPQTKSSMMLPLNPQACWDWWGYTGDNYATRDGQQIKAISQIARSLAK
ncbi:MAG: poly(3-hydroxybutyrate) depolymerase [Paraglaciecola sp.]|jgi:poly(3-hydroxybutyrate) depolymerase